MSALSFVSFLLSFALEDELRVLLIRFPFLGAEVGGVGLFKQVRLLPLDLICSGVTHTLVLASFCWGTAAFDGVVDDDIEAK